MTIDQGILKVPRSFSQNFKIYAFMKGRRATSINTSISTLFASEVSGPSKRFRSLPTIKTPEVNVKWKKLALARKNCIDIRICLQNLRVFAHVLKRAPFSIIYP